MRVGVILSLLSRGNPLVVNNKIDREKDTFKPNVNVRGSIDQQEFKRVYDSVVKVDI